MTLRSLFLIIFLFVTSTAYAEIVFQTDFNASPDWQSKQTVSKDAGGFDISWSLSRADTCDEYCPPQGFASYRAAASTWGDDQMKDTFVLSAEGARGGSGKGITYNVEVTGEYGIWSGGSLDV